MAIINTAGIGMVTKDTKNLKNVRIQQKLKPELNVDQDV